jgi:uncharacterized protein YecE (DUF72 family)
MIKIGIGGWVFEPWRGVFYPSGLPQARELGFAGEKLTAIEVNGTYYGTQKPATFRKWAGDVPDGFVFALKAPRFATNRRVLAEAGPSIEKFVESGISELGKKLGPILWQFMPTKKFDPDDFSAFLDLLPKEADGHRLRHAVEVRHESFVTPAFIDMVRGRGVAVVYARSDTYPEIADPTADFVYARLQSTREDETTGYSPSELDTWAGRVRIWAKGGTPADLPLLGAKPKEQARDCFVFFISGAKVHNPAAAMALIGRLGA